MHTIRSPKRMLLSGVCSALFVGPFVGTGVAAPDTSARPITYWVSPNGHGSICSTQLPCSLQTAQSMVRATNRLIGASVDVVLSDGIYRLDRTLAFDAAKGDGAQNGSTVTYEAAPGAHPVLSGGIQVTGWHQGANGIWEAPMPLGIDVRQLYVNGVRALRASGPSPSSFARTSTGYTMSNATLSSWTNLSEIEFVYDVDWTQIRCGVASVSAATVTMKQPCFGNSTEKGYGVNADLPTYIENARELLTNPGQWYRDKSTHTIYYIPREGQNLNTADVEIPSLQTLVSGTGTELNPLTGLALNGIAFEYAGWTAPDTGDGFAEVQANMHLTGQNAWQLQGTCDRFSSTNPGTCPYGNWTMVPGNVVFDHTSSLTVTGCLFEHLGAAGLQLGQDVEGSTVADNIFTDISSNGIEIGNGTDADPADTSLLPSGNTISDNWVHNVAVEYTGGVGIFQGYTRNDLIEHNQINNVPYSGISSNWGWGRTPTETVSNKILNNLVFDYMQQRSDGGGVYVLGPEGDSLPDGLLVSGNVVRYAAGGGHAIYTDGGSEFITMTGNVMYGNDTPSMGGCDEQDGTPYGSFSFTGNYVEDTTPDWPCGNPASTTINNTQIGSDGTGVPVSLLTAAGLEPQYASLIQPPTGATPTNLAAGKPVQAQFLNGSTAQLQPYSQLQYATDGNPNTYIQASGQFLWQLVVDLQAEYALGVVTVGMPQPHFATAFHVDISTDGATWTTEESIKDCGWGTIPVVFPSPVAARYVRIVADMPNNSGQRGDQMAISEVGAYAPTSGPENVALNMPAQALFIDGTQATMQPNLQPSFANDGNPATWSQATGQYRWIQQIDLEQPQSISVISLLQPDDKFATNWHVDISLDGSSFYTVARHADTAGGLSGVQLDHSVTARYVRIIADRPDGGGQNGGQMAVSEIGIYGLQ